MKTNWNELLEPWRSEHGKNFGELVRQCMTRESAGATVDSILSDLKARTVATTNLLDAPLPYNVWATAGGIEQGAYDQMNTVARLPVFVAGALMPDAHQGYGMPIGGVAALDNAVAPYLVGVDIGCRVSASTFMIDGKFEHVRSELEGAVKSVARFGFTTLNETHRVMSDPLWGKVDVLRANRERAQAQLGTSGGGNHFVDLMHYGWCTPGIYAIICHSGSRGVGAQVAKHYAQRAVEYCQQNRIVVPDHYAYIGIDSDILDEYFQVHNLMLRYSQACHELIMARFYAALGKLAAPLESIGSGVLAYPGGSTTPRLFRILTNPHNFVDIETFGDDKRMVLVHRKGATPAFNNTLGIIPGSSGSNSYVVRGLGNPASLNSASHGAGRPRSRTASKKLHNPERFAEHMRANDIHYVGISADETVAAYKDIGDVMAAQCDLVEPVAVMRPFFVAMGAESDDGD